MKYIFLVATITILASCGALNKSNESIEGVYDVSCGKCNFEMTGNGCDLAIQVEGKNYYVEGSNLHEHGNAHAEDGMCVVTLKAKVKGTISKGVFVAESLELLPYEK